MDTLVSGGLCGMVDALVSGMPVGTHSGTGVLLGLAQPDALRLSRGPVEAAGVGMVVGPDDVLVRCNFATLEAREGRFAIVDRRAGRIAEGADELSEALCHLSIGPGIKATLAPATQHRAVLRLSGDGLSPKITDTDPGGGFQHRGVLESHARQPDDMAAVRTAEALNRFTREAFQRLDDHPVNRVRRARGLPVANGLVCRSAGVAGNLRSLLDRFRVRAAVVAGERTVIGLARLFGHTVCTEAGFDGLPSTDLGGKMAAAAKALEGHDLVFVHIKAPDICSHDLSPRCKMEILERVDAVLAPLLDEQLVVAVTGDHSTDSQLGRHTGDPVPSLLWLPGGRRDGATVFGESACMSGGLGRIPATSLLLSVLDAMGALPNYRTQDRDLFR